MSDELPIIKSDNPRFREGDTVRLVDQYDANQYPLLATITRGLPPAKPLSRRIRFRLWRQGRREAFALRIAPWLDREW